MLDSWPIMMKYIVGGSLTTIGTLSAIFGGYILSDAWKGQSAIAGATSISKGGEGARGPFGISGGKGGDGPYGGGGGAVGRVIQLPGGGTFFEGSAGGGGGGTLGGGNGGDAGNAKGGNGARP
jgi:hypothetical protein